MNSPFNDHSRAAPQSHGQLVELAAKLSDREIYTADREKLITDLASRRFQFNAIVQQITKSYVSDLDSHRDGMTVEGVLLTTDIAVQVQFPAELNEPISILQPGDSVLVDGVLNRWMTGLDRLEFWSGSPHTETPDAAAVDETPAAVVADTTLANNPPGEAPAGEVEPPLPTASDKPAEPPSHLDNSNDGTPPTESTVTAGNASDAAPADSHQEPLTSDSGTPPDAPAFTVATGADDKIEETTPTETSGAGDDITQQLPAARTAFAQRRSTITSQQITEHLATSCSVTELQAAAAIEALWSILTDSRHYSGGRSALEIPFFGRFRLVTGYDHTELEFDSHTRSVFQEEVATRASQRSQARQRRLAAEQEAARQEQLQLLAGQIYHQHSRLPVSAMQASAPTGDDALSEVPFEQQLARATSASANVDLETARQLTWELIETLCAIMAHGKVSIRWARRGEMIPSGDSGDVAYRFRTYSTFGKKFPELPGSGKKRRRKKNNRSKVRTSQAAVSRNPDAGPIGNAIMLFFYVMLIVVTALCLMIPLTGVFGLFSGNPDDTVAAVFAIIIGMAISFVPCRISYSVTRDYWRQKRRR